MLEREKEARTSSQKSTKRFHEKLVQNNDVNWVSNIWPKLDSLMDRKLTHLLDIFVFINKNII